MARSKAGSIFLKTLLPVVRCGDGNLLRPPTRCSLNSNFALFCSSQFQFGFQLPFRFQFRCRFNSNDANAKKIDYVDDPELFLKSVRQQCKLGFSKVDHALSLVRRMTSLHPLPSIVDFNKLFTAIVKIKP